MVEPLTKAEVKKFLQRLDRYRDIAITYLMLLCGLRSREVLGLGIGDVDLDECRIRVLGKGSKERVLPLPATLRSFAGATANAHRFRHTFGTDTRAIRIDAYRAAKYDGLVMPKLYDYFGLVLFFYSNEHEPIHIHASRDGRENKIEIALEDGKVTSRKIKSVQGRTPLNASDQKKFKRVVEVLADEIVQHWVNYFVYHRAIVPKAITKKL